MQQRRETLSTVATIADIVAALGVVVSLVYVGGEVRRNTAATQAATYQQIVQESNDYLFALATDSALTAIVRRGEIDPTSLTGVETRRFFSYMRVFWRNMDNAFVQHQRGVLADAEWEVYRGIACRGLENSWQGLWDVHKNALSPEFVSIMDTC